MQQLHFPFFVPHPPANAAFQILKLLGIPWETIAEDVPGPIWTGEHLQLKPSHTVSDVLHEIGHWAYATSAERLQENFGCGPDPYRGGDKDATVRDALDNEIAACLIDVALHRWVGLDWVDRMAYLNLFEVGDLGESWTSFDNVLADADYRGHVAVLDRQRTHLDRDPLVVAGVDLTAVKGPIQHYKRRARTFDFMTSYTKELS